MDEPTSTTAQAEIATAAAAAAVPRRLTTAALLAELKREFLSWDQGLWYTARELLLRPGPMMAAVWRGEGQRFTSPIRFFMVSFTLYALTWISSGAMRIFWDSQQAATQSQLEAMGVKGKALDMGAIYMQHPLVSELGTVLAMWAATWIWFRGRDLNAAERAAMPLYWYGFVNFVQIPLFWVAFVASTVAYAQVLSIVSWCWVSWAVWAAFEPRSWWNVPRGALWWLTGALLWGFALQIASFAMR